MPRQKKTMPSTLKTSVICLLVIKEENVGVQGEINRNTYKGICEYFEIRGDYIDAEYNFEQ